jgi:hypothetical protein
MTLLDFGKLNIYISSIHLQKKQYVLSMISMFNLPIFLLYMLVTPLLSLVFICGIVDMCINYGMQCLYPRKNEDDIIGHMDNPMGLHVQVNNMEARGEEESLDVVDRGIIHMKDIIYKHDIGKNGLVNPDVMHVKGNLQ